MIMAAAASHRYQEMTGTVVEASTSEPQVLSWNTLVERSSTKLYNDYTDIFCVGDVVSYTVDTRPTMVQEPLYVRLGVPPTPEQTERMESSRAPRVVDIVLLVDPMLQQSITERRQFVEEDCGVVHMVTEDGGMIKSERWGAVKFETRSLVLQHEYIHQCGGICESARTLIKIGRPVHMRAYAPPPSHSQWVAVSISPDGQEYTGEGIIVDVRHKHAFIGTKAFGHIFLPYEALRFKRDLLPHKEYYWPRLVGYRVKFRMAYSADGNPHRCPWRALHANVM